MEVTTYLDTDYFFDIDILFFYFRCYLDMDF